MPTSSRPLSMPILSQPVSPGWTSSQKGRRKSSRNMTMSSYHTIPNRNELNLDTQTRDELGHGVLIDLATLARHPIFRKKQGLYCGHDRVLGAVICHIAVEARIIYAHIFTKAGSMAVRDLPLERPKSAQPNGSDTPLDRTMTDVLATLIKEYFNRITWTRKAALRLPESVSGNLDNDHAYRLATTLEVCRTLPLSIPLLDFLSPKVSHEVFVDVIGKRDGYLWNFLPKVVSSQLSGIADIHEHTKCEVEDSEKRGNLMHEIFTTEKTYVSRLQHLQRDYALPFRAQSRKQKSVLGSYETNALFPTSLDAIVLLNQDFLHSLEKSSGDYEFALVLVNGFRDFRKIYARYLETSADLDNTLRNALKIPKFRESVDGIRAAAGANIGIRELVMEPVSRIPRYSLLVTSLLTATMSSNPAYAVLKEALALVKKIGNMEKDKQELSQEAVIKLAGLVSSWPNELVKSSVRVISYVDCQDILYPEVRFSDSFSGSCDDLTCSLILFSDRLIILKRQGHARIHDVLQKQRKGELGYRGYVPLTALKVIESADCLFLLLKDEVKGVSPGRWASRPLRKFVLPTAEASRFAQQILEAQASVKLPKESRQVENFQGFRLHYTAYELSQWSDEAVTSKNAIRIWEENADNDLSAFNLVVKQDNISDRYSCHVLSGQVREDVCKGVTTDILRKVIFEKIIDIQQGSWLSPQMYDDQIQVLVNNMCASMVLNQILSNSSALRVRPTSPSKIVSSFLGRKDRQLSPERSQNISYTYSEPELTSPTRSFEGHKIFKKRSTQFFSFNLNNKSVLGLETFLEGILQFECFPESDFVPLTALEEKQSRNLVNLIDKDPSKTFAIEGSPTKVVLHAFKAYCISVIAKKFPGACVFSESVCNDFRTQLKQAPELRRDRLRIMVSALPNLTRTVARSVLKAGVHVLSHSMESCRIQYLLILGAMLVPTLLVTGFISTIEVLLEDFIYLFGSESSSSDKFGTLTSVKSSMTLQPSFSQFGSASSHSISRYGTELGTLTTASRSPAKQSEFGSTPELVKGCSSTEDEVSIARSRSDSSVTHSLISDWVRRPKRLPTDQAISFDEHNIFGLTASESHLPNTRDIGMQQKSSTYCVPRSLENHLESSIALEPMTVKLKKGPEEQENTFMDTLESASFKHRSITPSRIPLRSPNMSDNNTLPMTIDHEAAQSDTELKLSSRKGSSLPRLPSNLVRRRKSLGISKSFSSHSFTFDDEISADFDLALKFSGLTPESGHVSPMTRHDSFTRKPGSDCDTEIQSHTDITNLSSEEPTNLTRNDIKNAIGRDCRLASCSTIRRISRRLEHTDIGPLNIPSTDVPSRSSTEPCFSVAPLPSGMEQQAVASRKAEAGCTARCREHLELLELELEHYKMLYRGAVEEIDITLDLANEQIEQLQNASNEGTIEATVLALLELEKEKNRRATMEIASLKERQRL